MDKWRTETLLGYTVMRRYSLCRGGPNSCADMVVKVAYSYPGHKMFNVVSEKGSGFVQDHVFRRLMEAETEAASDRVRDNTRINPRNYDFEILGSQDLDGRPSYVIRMQPKHKRRFLVDGRIWVDKEDFAVARIEGEPATSSFWVRSSHMVQCYKKIGPYWLVVSNHTENVVRFFGDAQLDIQYYDYQLQPADAQARAMRPQVAHP